MNRADGIAMNEKSIWYQVTVATISLAGFGVFAEATAPPADYLLSKAQARQFDISYELNEDAQPVESVDLWYTFDEGKTWHMYGRDADNISPMSFSAPQEGLCGLYFVIKNAAGVSSTSPAAETEPQLWIFIDFTPPIGQMHTPELDFRPADQRIMKIQWTAIDANLSSRPIDLAYRSLPNGDWIDVRHKLPNSGRYDWRVPKELTGEIMVRLTVRDRGGHQTQSATSAICIDKKEELIANVSTLIPEAASEKKESTPSERDIRRAKELVQKGAWHQLRNEHELASARFRDALRLDPQRWDALVKLGGSMYALGRFKESTGAYELALREVPANREALDGIARAYVALKDYRAAEANLLSIVEHDPKDVQAWLNLGDVCIYRGNEVGARDNYVKAMTLCPDKEAIVSKAKARLQDLPSLRRRYNKPANQ